MNKDNKKKQSRGISITFIVIWVLMLLAVFPALIAIGQSEYYQGGNKFVFSLSRLLLIVILLALTALAVDSIVNLNN